MAQQTFKKGDRVIKARRYSDAKHCRYGGFSTSVPLGTEGTITVDYGTDDKFEVRFDTSISWSVDASELDHKDLGKVTGSRSAPFKVSGKINIDGTYS